MPKFEELLAQLSNEFERLSNENRELSVANAALRLDASEMVMGRAESYNSLGSRSPSAPSTPRKSFLSLGHRSSPAVAAVASGGHAHASGGLLEAPVPAFGKLLVEEPEPPPESSVQRPGLPMLLDKGDGNEGAAGACEEDPATGAPVKRVRLSVTSAFSTSMMGAFVSEQKDSPSSPLAIARMALTSRRIRGKWSYVINPEENAFLQRWNVIAIVSLAFVAVVAPVQVAILKGNDPDALFVVNCLIDIAFFFDLFLQFFIMYPKTTDYGFEWERCPKAIAKHYVKTWFVVDLISVIPFDLLNKLASSESNHEIKVIKVIRLLRLLKLARVLKASRLMRRVEVSSSIRYGQMDLFKFFVILVLLTHWLANLWALTLVIVDENDGVPRWIDAFDEQDKNVLAKTKDTPWKLYLTCFYFVAYTLTSVGYGDIGPANIVETVVLTFMVVVAGTAWAVVLAQVCGIVSNLDSGEQAFRQTMDELNDMMRDRLIPYSLRFRLRSFFLSNKTAQHRTKHERLIASMSPGLRGEVVMAMNRRWIANVSFLNQFMVDASQTKAGPQSSSFSALIMEVSQQMQFAVHAQSEIFGERQELYILIRGLASHGVRLRRTGSVWGLDFVLADTSLCETAQCFALTYVELTTLKRRDFLQLVDKYRTTCPELRRRVRRFCCWLAFQRAIMKEARRRQRKMKLRQDGGSKETIARAMSKVSFAFPVDSEPSPYVQSHGQAEQWGSAEQWGVPAEGEDSEVSPDSSPELPAHAERRGGAAEAQTAPPSPF